MTFLNILGVTEILCSFKLVLEGKKDTWVIKISVFRKVFSKLFCIIRNRRQNLWAVESGGIADLPLLKTLLAIRQKSCESNFWETIDSFVLLSYASSTASRTLTTITSLSELYFGIRFMLLAQMKKVISMNKHKQLKIIEMNEAWSDIFYEGYIHQFQPTEEYFSKQKSSCCTYT